MLVALKLILESAQKQQSVKKFSISVILCPMNLRVQCNLEALKLIEETISSPGDNFESTDNSPESTNIISATKALAVNLLNIQMKESTLEFRDRIFFIIQLTNWLLFMDFRLKWISSTIY